MMNDNATAEENLSKRSEKGAVSEMSPLRSIPVSQELRRVFRADLRERHPVSFKPLAKLGREVKLTATV